jgi:threonine aldolase
MLDSPTNQQFPILPRAMIEALSKDFAFMVWPDNGEAEIPTRFCTSWATTEEQVNTLIKAIEAL